MFTTPEEPTGIFKLLLDAIKITKPRDFENNPRKITSDEDFGFSSRRPFATGNKKDRQIWKRNQACDRDQICERCGIDRGKKLWAKKSCNCYSWTYKPKMPWKF